MQWRHTPYTRGADRKAPCVAARTLWNAEESWPSARVEAGARLTCPKSSRLLPCTGLTSRRPVVPSRALEPRWFRCATAPRPRPTSFGQRQQTISARALLIATTSSRVSSRGRGGGAGLRFLTGARPRWPLRTIRATGSMRNSCHAIATRCGDGRGPMRVEDIATRFVFSGAISALGG